MTQVEPTIHDALSAIEIIDNRGGPPLADAAKYYRLRDLVFRHAASGEADELGTLGAWPVALIPAISWLIGLSVAGSIAYGAISGATTVEASIKEMVPWVARGAGFAAVWWLLGRPGKATLPALLGVGRPRQTKTVQTTYKDPLGPGSNYDY
jgi:hypothetical protein